MSWDNSKKRSVLQGVGTMVDHRDAYGAPNDPPSRSTAGTETPR
jgi:hypothetical protein